MISPSSAAVAISTGTDTEGAAVRYTSAPRWLDVLPCTGIVTEKLAKLRPGYRFDVVERTFTMPELAAAIVQALDRPTVLVGHSAGGFPITAAAEKDPTRIAALVYLCAYVPQAGQSLAQMRRDGPSQPLARSFRLNADRTTFTFDPAIAADRFYHDCPPHIAAMALSRLTPQPLAPQETALPATARAKRLPRHYIRCTADRTIPPAYQTAMAAGIPVTDLPTGHSPFLAAPEALAQRLSEIAALTLSTGGLTD